MDLPILSELQKVGQRRNCRNSPVICCHLSFMNEDLQVLLSLFVILSERLYDLSVPNADFQCTELNIIFTFTNYLYISGWVSGSCDISPR